LNLVLEVKDGQFSNAQKEFLPVLLKLATEKFGLNCQTCTEIPEEMLSAWRFVVGKSEKPFVFDEMTEKLAESPFPMQQMDWLQVQRAKSALESLSKKLDKSPPGSSHEDANPHKHSSPSQSATASWTSETTENKNQTVIAVGRIHEYPTPTTEETQNMSGTSKRGGFFASPPKLKSDDLSALKKHVLNLSRGKFSSGGDFTTTESEVRMIFERHIPQWLESENRSHLDIVFYSHGGLTNEGWGLATAHKQVEFWLQNGVYPIFFVWETGILETIWQSIRDSWLPSSSRGIFDNIGEAVSELNDQVWASTIKAARVPLLWSGMKSSARSSFEAGGAGVYVLEKFFDFVEESDFDVRPHAVGHSAGSIFLSHMIAAANDYESYPKFETVHFLAPAITNELFQQTLMPIVGKGADDQAKHLSIFTMDDMTEREDTVGPYGKSLLYLIHDVLEPAPETPVLGLQKSLFADSKFADFFGLVGPESMLTDVIFSRTQSSAPVRERSNAVTHGAFDDDAATMESVVRRITDFPDGKELNKAFPGARSIEPTALPIERPSVGSSQSQFVPNVDSARIGGGDPQQGTRRALCIGIDKYSAAPLSGCENDARAWADWLGETGFEVKTLLSSQATRSGMVEGIRELFQISKPGDVAVIQYAGHGTKVPDENGDEENGDTPGHDEALVPFDYLDNGLLLDDDIGELCLNGIATGVNATFFFDCCHSGTATRMFVSADAGSGVARFLPPTEAMREANRRSRASRGATPNGNPYKGKKEILFAACNSGEVAWESGGSGDFTRVAVEILRQTGGQLSCADFMQRVVSALGPSARQTPGLWCSSNLRQSTLLGIGHASSSGQAPTKQTNHDLVHALKLLVEKFSNPSNGGQVF
jgi:hypothetical protein